MNKEVSHHFKKQGKIFAMSCKIFRHTTGFGVLNSERIRGDKEEDWITDSFQVPPDTRLLPQEPYNWESRCDCECHFEPAAGLAISK